MNELESINTLIMLNGIVLICVISCSFYSGYRLRRKSREQLEKLLDYSDFRMKTHEKHINKLINDLIKLMPGKRDDLEGFDGK